MHTLTAAIYTRV